MTDYEKVESLTTFESIAAFCVKAQKDGKLDKDCLILKPDEDSDGYLLFSPKEAGWLKACRHWLKNHPSEDPHNKYEMLESIRRYDHNQEERNNCDPAQIALCCVRMLVMAERVIRRTDSDSQAINKQLVECACALMNIDKDLISLEADSKNTERKWINNEGNTPLNIVLKTLAMVCSLEG